MMALFRAFARSERRFVAVVALALLLAGGAAGWILRAPSPPTAMAVAAAAIDDADTDGVPDLVEASVWGTDSRQADTDGDGLPDAWEIAHARHAPSGRPCPDPLTPDASRSCIVKSITLAEDRARATDPWSADTDSDGVPDAFEISHAMDPLVDDSSLDTINAGITNLERYRVGARADAIDTACSAMSDAEKLTRGLDASIQSTGGSGVPDGWALHFGLDPRDPAIGVAHLDGDPLGLTVLEKARASFDLVDLCAKAARAAPPFERGLDPRSPDSDHDGLPDAWEIRYGLLPNDPADASKDADGDGLTNLQAYASGLCPDKLDCDDDGLTNREELVGWNATVNGAARRVTSDPMRAVTDGDLIPDGAKRRGEWNGSAFPPLDPRTSDTDGDGIPDALEVKRYAAVLDPTRSDTDADGLRDGEEAEYWDARAAADTARADTLCALCGTPVNVANPDVDEDSIPDGEEVHPAPRPIASGSREVADFPATDPAAVDTDGDGLSDAWERENAHYLVEDGLWDLDPTKLDSLADAGRAPSCGEPCDDSTRDLDEDGLANRYERDAGADPHAADTDADGLPDGWEARHGRIFGARYSALATPIRGFSWSPEANAPSPLSPTNPNDARAQLAKYEYVRWSTNASAAPWERASHVGAAWRFAGSVTWTILDAYKLGASPLRPDASVDGIPDFIKIARTTPPVGAPTLFTVGDGTDGTRDPDGDGLTSAREILLGTDPSMPDSDLGGLPDGLETLLGLDALAPTDDASDGDADRDGLSNRDEIETFATDPNDPDTDGDGLLDGPDVTVVETSLRARLDALGIAHRGNKYYGEFSVSQDSARQCALKWSCSGDGLPDAWKVYYGLDASSYHPASESRTADGLTLLEKYGHGKPSWWSEEEHGSWWLGLDPTRRDTNRDGIRDDVLTDLDLDGLNDALGEDPDPYYGNVGVRDRGAVFAALQTRESATRTAPTLLPASMEVTTSPPLTILKGGSVAIRGKLVSAGAVGDIPILAQLVSGDAPAGDQRSGTPERIVGIGKTTGNGSFELVIRLAPDQVATLPGDTVLFSAVRPAGIFAWESETSSLVPGRSYRLLLWSYAKENVSGASWLTAEATRIEASARPDVPTELRGAPGEDVRIDAILRDGAGDTQSLARPDALRLIVAGAEIAPTRTDRANATFYYHIPADAAEPITARIRYEGDARVSAGEATMRILPILATTIRASLPRPVISPGEMLRLTGNVIDERARPPSGNVAVSLGNLSWNATIGPEGGFSLERELPSWTPLGARPIQIRYAGDPLHAVAERSLSGLTVRATPEFSNLTGSASLGSGGVIDGRLLSAGTGFIDPLAGTAPAVRLRVGGYDRIVTPDATGGFRFRLPPSLTTRPEILDVELTSEGSALVEPAVASLELVVSSPTTLTLAAHDVTRGTDLAVEGELTTLDGTPAAERNVTLDALGASLPATTDARGHLRWKIAIPSNEPTRSVTLRGIFAGEGPYGPSNATVNVRVLPRVVATVSPMIVRPETTTLLARIATDAGAPAGVTRARVTFSDETTSIPVASDGTLSIAVPSTLPRVDAVPLRIVAETGWTERFTIRVARPTNLSLDLAPEAAPGEELSIGARLIDDLGLGVSGRNVTFEMSKVPLGHAVTDATGRARTTVRIPANLSGDAAVQSRFIGDETRLPSAATARITVRSPTELHLDVSRSHVSVLATSAGKPLANATVIVEIAGAGRVSVSTSETGIAQIPLRVAGDVRADLIGTSTLLSASARASAPQDPVFVVRNSPPLPGWLVPASLALLAAGILFVVFFAWKKRTRDALAVALTNASEAFLARDERAAAIVLAYRALLDALHSRGFTIHASTTPRELQAILARDLQLPVAPLERVVAAFEAARYGSGPTSVAETTAARDALRELSSALRREAA